MHLSVKLTDAIQLLQLEISSPIIHAFGPESSPHQDLNLGPQLERWTTYQLSPFHIANYMYNNSATFRWSII